MIEELEQIGKVDCLEEEQDKRMEEIDLDWNWVLVNQTDSKPWECDEAQGNKEHHKVIQAMVQLDADVLHG